MVTTNYLDITMTLRLLTNDDMRQRRIAYGMNLGKYTNALGAISHGISASLTCYVLPLAFLKLALTYTSILLRH